MNNKRLGNAFEKQFCILASEHGFWCHRLQDNKNGQPADVLMSKNNTPVLLDCKVCENSVFPLSRIEENQWNAMTMWLRKGNKYAMFALEINKEVWMISFEALKCYKDNGVKQLNLTQILTQGIPFQVWQEAF